MQFVALSRILVASAVMVAAGTADSAERKSPPRAVEISRPAVNTAASAEQRTVEYQSEIVPSGVWQDRVRPAQFVQELTPISDTRPANTGRQPSQRASADSHQHAAGGLYIPPTNSASDSEPAVHPQRDANTAPPARRDLSPDTTAQRNSTSANPTRNSTPPANISSPWDFDQDLPAYSPVTPADAEPAFDPPAEVDVTPQFESSPSFDPSGQTPPFNAPLPQDAMATQRDLTAPSAQPLREPADSIISQQRMTAHVANAPPSDPAPATPVTPISQSPAVPEATGAAAPASTSIPVPSTSVPSTNVASTIDPYSTTHASTSGAEAGDSPTSNPPSGSTYFFTLLILFASLGMNLYLGWIAWDTYNRYQELVSEMGASHPRRDRADQDGHRERPFRRRLRFEG